ncbi:MULTISPECIES: hypothetical protein [unclassified Sphingomonas]|uniref:hypothetical protein n=1 Tax=unclassified Sphingomonas TaxID=196159 RepID=UPI0008336A52|nr:MULTISPECIES: hypothetical protein [unclassified Sphingomonas]
MIARLMLATTALIALTPTPGAAQAVKPDPKNRQFTYFLPRANVAAVVTQRIAACPVPDPKDPTKVIGLKINTSILPGAQIYADPEARFTVDARAGFLSKRSTKLALRPDGTLEALNVSSEGRGGEMIGSLITVAATVASWGAAAAPAALTGAFAGVGEGLPGIKIYRRDEGGTKAQPRPQPAPIRCKQSVLDSLSRLDDVQADIARLEARIVDGKASAADATLLQLRRGEEADLMGSLTLKAGKGIEFDPERASFAQSADKSLPVLSATIPAVDYGEWIERLDNDGVRYVKATAADVARHFDELPGRHGFVGTLSVDGPMYHALAGQPRPDQRRAERFIFYRRLVPVVLAVKPCRAPAQGTSCAPEERPKRNMTKSASFSLPQLSGLFGFSIGAGGLFGTREAAVKLDATGAPIALEYGSGSGGAQIAGVVDKGLAGATLMRDAQLAATKRSIEAITAERELAELLASRPAN